MFQAIFKQNFCELIKMNSGHTGVADCVQKYGWEIIEKMRLLHSCSGSMEDLPTEIITKLALLVDMTAADMTEAYEFVLTNAPVLLVFPKDTLPLVLMPATTVCLSGCLYTKGAKRNEPYRLEVHNESTEGVLFGAGGTRTKVLIPNLRCRGKSNTCGSRYLYDMYLDGSTGKYSFYDQPAAHVRITSKIFWTRDLCLLLTNSIVHTQSTFDGFAAVWSQTYALTEQFSRLNVSDAFFRFEIERELRETDTHTFDFVSDLELDEVLPQIDELRCKSPYQHQCSTKCKERGCGLLFAIDGNWKNTMQHCAFVQENTVSNIQLLNFPKICPGEVERKKGALFCIRHRSIAEALDIPAYRSDVRGMLTSGNLHLQGVDGFLTQLTNATIELPIEQKDTTHAGEGKNCQKVSSRKKFKSLKTTESDMKSGEIFSEGSSCSKNSGQLTVQSTRTKGYVFIVRAGGHIETFSPIYGAESLSQVFLIVISWLYGILQNVPESKWGDIFLAYDNMCQLDKLKATKEKLPLPQPYDQMWAKVSKVIDAFHLGNHVGHDCKTIYNPNRIKETHPDLKSSNTQCAEQCFSWFRKYKQNTYKMPKSRQLFYFHRIITLHNRYLEFQLKD